VLTFVILASFAVLVGVLTTRQVTRQFNNEVHAAADELKQDLDGELRFAGGQIENCNQSVNLTDYARPEQAQIRIFDEYTGDLLCRQGPVRKSGHTPVKVQGLTTPPAQVSGTFTEAGYRVAARELRAQPIGRLVLLYARPISAVDHTLNRVRFFLILGVLGGTVLALLAGLATAQRAMGPIAELSAAASEIERTRDPRRRIPHPEANDEVAELARTLEGMLGALDSARGETETMLERQREFVADASHELRTPLTSVLANLELLAEELDGEQAESAQAALRSTRRMRRLVGDLLLLARADAKRAHPHRRTDLASALTEAAAELGPMASDHELSVTAEPAVIEGVRDDLHRLALNLLENAMRHTPPGTSVRAWTTTENDTAVLTVEDDGPGIPAEIERRVFERFVRGGGDGGRGSGLGLAIVSAVAQVHGGTVTLEHPDGTGTRFVIRFPAAGAAAAEHPAPAGDGSAGDASAAAGNGPAAVEEAQTSTTTGSTIGRRRNRS
jgi:signal transduction histidine kinase